MENAYQLLHKHCDLTFFLSTYHTLELLEEFPSRSKVKTHANELPAFISFWPLLWKCRKYDHILISTGPEGEHYTNYISLLLFYLLTLFYGKKITLTMRSARAYIPRKGKNELFSIIRNKIAKNVSRFTFETLTCLNSYVREGGHPNPLCGLSYVRYTDYLEEKYNYMPPLTDKMPVRIGLLGVIRHDKRDYQTVIEAVQKLSKEEQNKIEFVNAAYCPDAANNSVIKELKKYCSIDISDGFLSTKEFDEKGSSCHLLLSPVAEELEYGQYKGSGSFGDSVYFRKRILMPKYADPFGDFSEIEHCYSNSSELAALFRDATNLAMQEIDKDFIESFSTKNVYTTLKNDLNICP